jgi:hypothetical protein
LALTIFESLDYRKDDVLLAASAIAVEPVETVLDRLEPSNYRATAS